jgi:hypothetical protein
LLFGRILDEIGRDLVGEKGDVGVWKLREAAE